MTEESRPTFVGIGGHKCASTWLSECMREHPEIFVSEPKEIAYFSHRFERGSQWYFGHFEKAIGHRQAGEFTSHYLYDPRVPERILATLGTVPVLAVVRDPVARALSQLKYGIRHGHLAPPPRLEISLVELLAAMDKYPEIVERSLYAEGIQRFVSAMGVNRVLILDQEDCSAFSSAVLEKVWRFLGVRGSFLPSRASKVISAGINPRFQFLERFRTRVFYFLNERWPHAITLGRRVRIGEMYRRLNAGHRIFLSREATGYLRDYFDQDWSVTQTYCWRPSDGRARDEAELVPLEQERGGASDADVGR